MDSEILWAGGYILGAVASVVGLLLWKRAHTLASMLAKQNENFALLGQKLESASLEAQKREDKIVVHRENEKRVGRLLEEANVRIEAIEKKVLKEKSATESELKRLRLMHEDAQMQMTALTAQIVEREVECQAMRKSQSQLESDRSKASQSAKREFEEKMDQLRSKCRSLETENRALNERYSALHKKVESINLPELMTMKRKAAQYLKLYQVMRGLREMSDERNRNWETAIASLSKWVIEKKTGRLPLPELKFGALMGEALDLVGVNLESSLVHQDEKKHEESILAEERAILAGHLPNDNSGLMHPNGL